MAKETRGRDVSAPETHVVINGTRYTLVHNNRAARIAEDIYESKFNRDIGYYGILAEMAIPKHRAVMAMVYGAVVAGGAEITWEEFDEVFELTNIEGMAEMIREGVLQSLPEDDPEAEGKNPEATPTE